MISTNTPSETNLYVPKWGVTNMTDELQPLGVEEGIVRFLRHREPELEQSSMENARTRMNHFREWAVGVAEIENLNKLTGRDLADFVAWRRPQIAALTLQKQLSTPRQALRFWADIEAVQMASQRSYTLPNYLTVQRRVRTI